MEPTTNEIIRHLSIISAFIPLSFYLLKLKSQVKQNAIIAYFLIVSVICEIIEAYLYKNQIQNGLVMNAHDILQFIMLSWFYYEILFKERWREIFVTGICLYVTFIGGCLIKRLDFTNHLNMLWTLSGAIFIIFGILYCTYLLIVVPARDTNVLSAVTFSFSIMFYFVMTICFFVTGEYILTVVDDSISRLLWSIHNVVNIIKNVGFALAFHFTGRLFMKL